MHVFGEIETGWLVAILTAVGGFLVTMGGVAGTVLEKWRDGKKQARADAIAEWKELHEETQRIAQKQIDTLTAQVAAQSGQIFSLHEKVADCERERAETIGELRLLRQDMQRLQVMTGDELPGTILPGVVVAETDGTIRVVSPALTSILGWLPDELVGKNLTVMVPPELRPAHEAAMLAIKNGKPPPAGRILETECLTESGKRMKVTVTVKGIPTKGGVLISGEIKPRGSDLINLSRANRGPVTVTKRKEKA